MTTDHHAPKVFISHASEDKRRFVEGFTKKLRENGIDAWLDQWEIFPGDDLPHSIFEKGIKSADAVIVVLSSDFVRKPWPQQELSASLIRRVRGDIRIIPVVIENCEIPQSLQSTLWVQISDLSNYDDEFKRIVMAVFEVSSKPPVGRPPTYSALMVDNIPGLSELDTEVLKHVCKLALDTNAWVIDSSVLENLVEEWQVPRSEIADSVAILEDRGLIDPHWTLGGSLPDFTITLHGFENYARFFIPGFNAIVESSILAIVNHNIRSAVSLANHLDQNRMLIEYVLDILSSRKYIDMDRHQGSREGAIIHGITPQGKRYVAKLNHPITG